MSPPPPRPLRTHKRVCVSCTLGPRGRSKSRQHPPMLAGSAPLELRLYKRLRGEGPSKRPRTGLHRRPCVSAHVCHARARAQQCTTSTTAVQLYGRALASSVRGFSTMSHLRRRGASLRLAAHHVHGHLATRQPAPPPHLSRPLGRSHLSVGAGKCSFGVAAPPTAQATSDHAKKGLDKGQA